MNEKELNKMPPLTRSAVSGLTDGQRRMFNSEYGQKRYRTPEAYALWLVFGLHYAVNPHVTGVDATLGLGATCNEPPTHEGLVEAHRGH
jgi:hypothetical protein